MAPPPSFYLGDVYEKRTRRGSTHMTSARWYATTTRLPDGSILILGGMIAGGYNNQLATDNPTFEFFPPKGDGRGIYSKFLHDALNTNLFPVTYLLPSGDIFVAANTMSMIYNVNTNTEHRLPTIPNGVRVTYPETAASALLPTTWANNWQHPCEQPVCSDRSECNWDYCGMADGDYAGGEGHGRGGHYARRQGLHRQQRRLWSRGIRQRLGGNRSVERREPGPHPNALRPLRCTGQRFSSNFPSSKIERMYHNSATLVPDGCIFISGSNPNDDVSTRTYETRYTNDFFSPQYLSLLSLVRPMFSGQPTHIQYGANFTIPINVLPTAKLVQAVIMDLGFSTHSVYMNSRYVELPAWRNGTKQFLVAGPSSTALFPPGYAWLFVLADGVPSKGTRVMIGTGVGPPVSESAIANLLKNTT